jgi:hypothetical protein
MCVKFWSGSVKVKDHSVDLGVYGRIILKGKLEKQCEKVRAEFIWLRIGTSGGLL